MAYLTPKTDWAVRIVSGVYTGDFFNAADYNRIADNITYIAELAETLYSITITLETMRTMTPASIPYAEDFNALEANIQAVCDAVTMPASWSGQQTWYANGTAPLVSDWNRWEATVRDLKARIDYDARWVGFLTADDEVFITADGKEFKVLEA